MSRKPSQKSAQPPRRRRIHHVIKDHAKGHFIPHEHNGYVPHVLKHRVLAAYSAIFVLLKVLLIVGYAALPAASVYSSALTPDNVVRLTNLARTAAGLPELVANRLLASAADKKAVDMDAKQYFAHTSPEGRTPWQWIRESGYSYRHAGENLAVHYFDAEGVHDGWMASPTHRQNIVDERYTEIGVGVKHGRYQEFDTVFVVQMFGTPKTELAVAPEAVAQPAPEPAPAVKPAPTPAPAPAPVVAAAPPVIDESSVVVVPDGDGYDVEAKIEHASVAEAYVGAVVTPLVKDEEGTWRGHVEGVAVSPSPEPQHVFVGAANADGVRIAQSVMTVAPNAGTTDLFVSGGKPTGTFKMFGFLELRNLEDGVQRFYLFAILFLAAALVIKLIAAFERRNHPVVAHTMAVIALGVVLLIV